MGDDEEWPNNGRDVMCTYHWIDVASSYLCLRARVCVLVLLFVSGLLGYICTQPGASPVLYRTCTWTAVKLNEKKYFVSPHNRSVPPNAADPALVQVAVR